eukprot:11693795-Alexandrium_andersonii.AAC.1
MEPDDTPVRLRWMFADAMRKSPFCMPEAKAALADLWTHSVGCLDQMRDLAKKRSAGSSSAP